jgi:cell division protein FtsZ
VTIPGEINVDFADVKAILQGAGQAWLAIGTGRGEKRAVEAATKAINSPLLDMNIEDVKRLLFVVTGGPSLTLNELHMAAEVIESIADPEANIIFGTVKDMSMEDEVKVTLVAAAFPIPADGDNVETRMGIQRNPPPDLVGPSTDPDDLDVPSFLRRGQDPRQRGFYR